MRANSNPGQFMDYGEKDVIDSIMGSGNQDLSGISERDRRILLREMERKNRLQNGQALPQQYGGPPVVNAQPDIFGQQKSSAQIEQSKRDLIWQQKLQQKMGEVQQQNNYKPLDFQQLSANRVADVLLPIYNRDFNAPDPTSNFGAKFEMPSHLNIPSQMLWEQTQEVMKGPSPVRSSLTALKLQQAKELDNNFKQEEAKPPQYQQKPSLSPLISKNKQIDQNAGMLAVLGNNQYDMQRRENTKKLVQQEYNQFLAQQQPRKIGTVYEGDGFIGGSENYLRQRANSASRQVGDKDSSLLISGLQQMTGLQNPEDEKKRKLMENKAIAMINQQMAAAKKEQSSGQSQGGVDQRRKQFVDQVFDEVVESSRQIPQYQQQQNQPQVQGLPPRQWSGVNRRQQDVQKLQNQSAEDPFFKARLKQDEQKRFEQEKKKEYAAMLVQQMEAKKQRENPTQHYQREIYSQNQPVHFQQPQQTQFQPQQQFQQPQQFQPQQYQPQQFQQYPAYNDYQEPQQINYENDHYQTKPSAFAAQGFDPKIEQQRRQDEYRMDLHRQIQLKEEIKTREEQFGGRRMDQDYQRDASPIVHKELPQSIHDGGFRVGVRQDSSHNTGSRQRTDVTRPTEQQNDPQKEQKLLKYQEELRTQMEEQKRRKEEAKQKDLMTDLEIERKLQQERNHLKEKDRNELIKEGKRDPRDLDDRPKRQVRRDQFATSVENDGVVGDIHRYDSRPAVEPSPKYEKPVTESAIQMPFVKKSSNFELFSKPEVNDQMRADPMINFEQQFKHEVQQMMPTFHPQNIQNVFQQPQSFNSQPSNTPRQEEQWVVQQREQAGKMFEDQQKMIKLYQQALEQILQYRNQYFEQAMEMRENILKEREQLLEYEKLKQGQISEINQLKAVQSQLGNMMEVAKHNQQPILDKRAQNNLNDYIHKQKESILNLSRSSTQFAEVLKQNKQMFPEMMKITPRQHFELAVSSSRVEIPRQTRNVQNQIVYPEDGEDELQMKVDEIDMHLNNSVELGVYGASRFEDFEQSLNAESKLVRVPQSNLQMKAKEIHDQRQNNDDHLLSTWTENSMKKAQFEERPGSNASPLRIGMNQKEFQHRINQSEKVQDSRQLQIASNTTPKNKLLGKLVGNTSKSPLASSSVPPYTIQEQPDENDEDKALQSQSVKAFGDKSPRNHPQRPSIISYKGQVSEARVFSEQDFNDRNSDVENTPSKRNNEFHSNLKTIERLINQQNQPTGFSGIADRKQTVTGSSFYDKTLQNEKIQQAHQQEEVHKQMLRIFGNSSQSYYQAPAEHHTEEIKQENIPMGLRKSQQKSSTMKLRKSNDRLDIRVMKQEFQNAASRRDERNFNATESEINIANTQVDIIESPDRKGEVSIQQYEDESEEEDQNVWNDPDLVPPPVFPVYGDDNSQEMIVENNSSVGVNTMNQYNKRENSFNYDSNFMGMGRIPDSALNTFSPPESNRKVEFGTKIHQAQQDSEEIPDETFEEEVPFQNKKSPLKSPQSNRSPRQEVDVSKQSIQSKKQMEMAEIAALIRKATSQTHVAVQASQQKSQRQTSPFRTTEQAQSNAYKMNESKQSELYKHASTTQDFKSPQPIAGNDQILADLDKIIKNLEAQQKNMLTFGLQKLEKPMPDSDDEPQKYSKIEEENQDSESVAQSTTKKWKTLQDARDARRMQPETLEDKAEHRQTIAAKAGMPPLDPSKAPRPKSGKSHKSRNGSQHQRSNPGDASPQRAGKYTQMALQNTSQSPMRVGKYTNLALQNSPLVSDNGSQSKSPSAMKSPQRVGKYAQMAMNNSNLNKSNISTQSPSRMGKFAMMALQNQKEGCDVDKMSQKYSRALSGSRERENSVDRASLVQKMEKDIDSRIGGDNNENIVNNGQPILRPLSSVSKSSRYNNATQGAAMNSSIQADPVFRSNGDSNAKFHQSQKTVLAFNNTGNLRAQTDVKNYGAPLKAEYFSDEEEEQVPRHLKYQTPMSGKTEMTEKKQFGQQFIQHE